MMNQHEDMAESLDNDWNQKKIEFQKVQKFE
jgi:hypothetical protein